MMLLFAHRLLLLLCLSHLLDRHSTIASHTQLLSV